MIVLSSKWDSPFRLSRDLYNLETSSARTSSFLLVDGSPEVVASFDLLGVSSELESSPGAFQLRGYRLDVGFRNVKGPNSAPFPCCGWKCPAMTN
jgi:hypothetical protein